MSKHYRQSMADKQKKANKNTLLKKDIAEWQKKADTTDLDDEGGTKYDELYLKGLADEARTLLLRASLSL